MFMGERMGGGGGIDDIWSGPYREDMLPLLSNGGGGGGMSGSGMAAALVWNRRVVAESLVLLSRIFLVDQTAPVLVAAVDWWRRDAAIVDGVHNDDDGYNHGRYEFELGRSSDGSVCSGAVEVAVAAWRSWFLRTSRGTRRAAALASMSIYYSCEQGRFEGREEPVAGAQLRDGYIGDDKKGVE